MKTFKTKLPFFGLIAILLVTSWLTNCATGPTQTQLSARLYQPKYLFLKANQPIQSKEGVYTPQKDETWVAGWQYEELERESLLMKTALNKLQAEKEIK